MKSVGSYRARDLMKNVTLEFEIRGLRSWRVRVWIGLRLIKLAARLMGVGHTDIRWVGL